MTCKLGVIGGGNMGCAILDGALRVGLLTPADVLVVDTSSFARSQFEARGIRTSADAAHAAACEQMMLAVKPQVFTRVAESIGELKESKVVISIMAGLSSANIRDALGEQARIVRVMPNTPCRIGKGMAAIALGEGARQGDDELAARLFWACGKIARVEESQMHAVTAISGSGPAYVFLLAEAMQQAAEQMGLSHRLARTLVEQTIVGAGELLADSEETAMELREAVTSPGGTTAAALEVMFEKELPETIVEALLAARDRGVELDG